MNENKRKFVAGLITGLIVFGSLTFYASLTRAVAPSIAYAYPSDGATFVDVWRGHGINITVNVSDGDGDLNQVVLKWNNSGSWDTFYDSGALGGVSYHNHTILNSNFTGSWTTYEYQICAYDTAWTNTTYSFTTAYVWGDLQMVVYNDDDTLRKPSILKNSSSDEYFVAYCDDTSYYVKTITNNKNFYIDGTKKSVDYTANSGNPNDYHGDVTYLYTYNGSVCLAYIDYYSSDNALKWTYYRWNGSDWVDKTDTGILSNQYSPRGGVSVTYYDGNWMTFLTVKNSADSNIGFGYYTGLSPFSGSLTYIYQSYEAYYNFYPSSAILNGKLVLVYRDAGDDLHWKTYDGVAWTDKGDIEADIGAYGCSVVKDPVNNQLVLVYVNASKNMYYRILTDPDGTWSEPHLLFTPASGKTIKYPYAQYIDHRLVIVCSYNLRYTYDIYMISAPEYLSNASGGVLKQYNRIQFPDATPSQTHVNSSVFYFDNINSRNITWINWSFSDIGSIQCESNIKLWGSTDNSSWTAIGTSDTNGYVNMTTTTWAGGLPWQAGERRYFKLEILDVGAVPEDLHSVDEGIILKVGLA